MTFKDLIQKIKNFFQKDEISQESVNSLLPESEQIHAEPEKTETISELIQETPQIIEAKSVSDDNLDETIKEEIKEADSQSGHSEKPIILASEKPDASRRFISVDLNKLELNKIEREAETITAYSKLFAKDAALYKEEKSDSKLSGISTKFRMIFTHSMELKNLLELLNELFYIYLLNNLSETHRAVEKLKETKKKLDETIAHLAKLAGYDELFNPDKSSECQKNFDSELEKGDFLKEVNELGKYLVDAVNNKKIGIPANTVALINLLKEQQN